MEIRTLALSDDRAAFSCGDDEVDRHLHVRAGQAQFKQRSSVTYVAAEEQTILGYATVLAATCRDEDLSAVRRLPRGAPALLLARMGVSVSRQRGGIGRLLLKHLMKVALEQSRSVGCVGVLVDAKPGSRAFYERYGFTWVGELREDAPTRGFLPIGTIEDGLRPDSGRG